MRSSYTRQELLDIRDSTPEDIFITFIATSVEFLDILVKGALSLVHVVKRRRRGKRAGALVRLRQIGHRTSLPGIFLSSVSSLMDRLEELQLLVVKICDFSKSSVLCFTDTRLCGLTPDCALQLSGFQLFRADRHAQLSGKSKSGGICFYINSSWCNDVAVIQQHSSPDLESFFIKCRPFYSPLEFSSFILVGVFIPAHAAVQDAQRALANQILCVERTHPGSLVIVLGHFNKGNLAHELPQYTQFITTEKEDVVDHCYTSVSDAYRAIRRTFLGYSDLATVHLIPTYKQKLSPKRVARKPKRWTREALENLRACLECTDWEVFRSTTNSLDEYIEVVTSYIGFCEASCVPSRSRVSYGKP